MIIITAFEAVPGAGTEAGLAWNWGRAYVEAGHQVVVVTSGGTAAKARTSRWNAAGIEVVFLGEDSGIGAAQTPQELFLAERAFARWLVLCRSWVKANSAGATAVHHVSWGSVRLRPSFLEVGNSISTVWGPLGGGQFPTLSGLSPKNYIHECVRASSFPVAWLMRRIDFLRYSSPTLTLTTNTATLRFARSIGVTPVKGMLADGIDPEIIRDGSPKVLNSTIRLLWLGRMVASKRADIAVGVVAALMARGIPTTLMMIGDGPERKSLQKRAQRLGIAESVTFVGRIPWEETFDYYDESTFLLFTSMRDSSCPAVLEAAARGVPTLCLRHQGVGSMVPDSVAVGPTTFTRRAAFENSLADLVAAFRDDPLLYESASGHAIAFAHSQTWAAKVESVLHILSRRSVSEASRGV